MNDCRRSEAASPNSPYMSAAKEERAGNGAIWAIVLVGAIITLTDGLLRSASTDWEITGQDPLHYQAYSGAYVFAAVMLPLCFLYARRYALQKREALLLWFVLCTTTYTKDFAYIKVPGVPVFITDVVLLCLLFRYRVWRRNSKWAQPSSWVFKFMALYFAVGLFDLLRTWSSGADVLFAVRDFALVLYALFAFVTYEMIEDREAILRILLMFWLGAMLATVGAAGWFIAQPEQRRYVMYGAYIPAAFVGAIIAGLSGILPKRIAWASTFLLGIGILLQNARSSDLAFAVAFAVALLLRAVGNKKVSLSQLKPIFVVMIVCALILFLFSTTNTGSAFLQRTSEELLSGTVNYSDDDNAKFRFLAWTEAWGRFVEHPVVGEGYGIPFIFADVDTDPRPHNTYLTVLYKMGVVGFLPLLLCLLALYSRGINALRRGSMLGGPDLMVIILCGHFLIALAGGVGLLLESPFLACIFWIAIGLQARLTSPTFLQPSEQSRYLGKTRLSGAAQPIAGWQGSLQ